MSEAEPAPERGDETAEQQPAERPSEPETPGDGDPDEETAADVQEAFNA